MALNKHFIYNKLYLSDLAVFTLGGLGAAHYPLLDADLHVDGYLYFMKYKTTMRK